MEHIDPQTATVKIDGHKITKLRWLRGWSIERLAGESKLSRQTVSKIETGLSRGTPRTLFAIAEALGVEPRELLKAVGDEGVCGHGIE